MENQPKLKQITGAILAFIIFVFSFGSSFAASTAKPLASNNHASITKTVFNIAPLEGPGQRDVSVVHTAFIQVSPAVFKANIPFTRYINCKAFGVNPHARKAFYALPNTHAP